jgi:(p)ppGpp synthase/HD superfamily hydrolase
MLPPFAQDRPTVRAAVEWAVQMHASQRRESDGAPFILHPMEVASLLNGRGFDDEVIAAGALHDIVEKTDATLEDVRERFGPRVAEIVGAVSEDESIEGYEERKAALREQACAAGVDARAVYAADKITKARELRARVAHDPEQFARLFEHYNASLESLRAYDDGQPMVDQLEFELWALRTLPPR